MAVHLTPTGFYASSGVFLTFAVISGTVRTAIRLHRFRKFELDDWFLLVGLVLLISGTVLLYINVPLTYVQQKVEAGLKPPPPDFLETLVTDEKTQESGVVLVAGVIVCVKLAFLFFFRKLMARTGKRFIYWWWWFTLIVVIGFAPPMMFADFIACPYTRTEEIIEKCVSKAALNRQLNVVRATVVVDVLSDVFIISIPIVILWNVKISVQKKLSLISVLCLSVFMIACAVARVCLDRDNQDRVNALWILLWLELEACVAVITVSVSAFSILFTENNEGPDQDLIRETFVRRWIRTSGFSEKIPSSRVSETLDTNQLIPFAVSTQEINTSLSQLSTAYHYLTTTEQHNKLSSPS